MRGPDDRLLLYDAVECGKGGHATPEQVGAGALAGPVIGVDTSMMKLGLEPDGSMSVPPGAFPAGWYQFSPTPGEIGPSIISGHVDYKGPGVFQKLHLLKPGDTVTVTRQDGSTPRFTVTRVLTVPRLSSPPRWSTVPSVMPACAWSPVAGRSTRPPGITWTTSSCSPVLSVEGAVGTGSRGSGPVLVTVGAVGSARQTSVASH